MERTGIEPVTSGLQTQLMTRPHLTPIDRIGMTKPESAVLSDTACLRSTSVRSHRARTADALTGNEAMGPCCCAAEQEESQRVQGDIVAARELKQGRGWTVPSRCTTAHGAVAGGDLHRGTDVPPRRGGGVDRRRSQTPRRVASPRARGGRAAGTRHRWHGACGGRAHWAASSRGASRTDESGYRVLMGALASGGNVAEALRVMTTSERGRATTWAWRRAHRRESCIGTYSANRADTATRRRSGTT